MLYPENYRYLSDLLAYVAIGARSVEIQQHRLTASGISVPVGMKNPISEGNPYTHAILRGYVDFAGRSASNYHYENLLRVEELYEKSKLVNPSALRFYESCGLVPQKIGMEFIL